MDMKSEDIAEAVNTALFDDAAHIVIPSILELEILDDRVKIGENQLTTGSPLSAGLDISVWPEGPVILEPGDAAVLLPTGFKLWTNLKEVVALMYARSGTGHRGLVLGNGTGVIDADYQGEWKVSLLNRTEEAIVIEPGDRVAQVVFQHIVPTDMILASLSTVDKLSGVSGRGAGGWGSTGVATA